MFSAKRYLENIAAVQNTTELDQFMVKYFPKRRMLFIRNIAEIHLATTPDNTQGTTLGWENTLYALRKYLVDHHLPAALAASAGCMIEKESLLRRELCIRNFCIPVDENIEDENVSYIPEGSFLTFTPQTLTNADGALMEGYLSMKCWMKLRGAIARWRAIITRRPLRREFSTTSAIA